MRRVAVALAGAVVLGTIGYSALGGLIRGPSVFDDELAYMEGIRSLADGNRPIIRDRPFGRGLLYPVVAAPVFAVTPDQRSGYRAVRVLNAFLFSLVAVPVYLLARRLLDRRKSMAVAALAIAVPSALYTAMIMSESVAYLASAVALLALALAVERPTAQRQLASIAAVVLAASARPQLVALALVLPLGLMVRWLALAPETRPSAAAGLRRLWPTAVALGLGATVVTISIALGHLPAGDYRTVWRSYDLVSIGRWAWFTVADLTLYIAFIPLVAAPAALAALWRRGHRSAQEGSFAGVLLAANMVTLLVVATFSAAPFSGNRAHDRYIFYLVPLWLVLFAWFLDQAPQVSRRLAAAGGVLVVALMATLPPRLLIRDGNVQFDALATGLWSRVRDLDPAHPSLVRLAVVLAALGGTVAVAGARFLPRGARFALLVPVLATFVANAAIVWPMRIDDANRRVFADDRSTTWSWVDQIVPAGKVVANVYVDSGRCFPFVDDYRWTEFFNERIGPVFRLGLPAPPGLLIDGTDARIRRGGVVSTTKGRVVRPDYVVAEPGLHLRGRRVAEGTLARLSLWRLQGELRVTNARSNVDAIRVACRRGRS